MELQALELLLPVNFSDSDDDLDEGAEPQDLDDENIDELELEDEDTEDDESLESLRAKEAFEGNEVGSEDEE